MTIPSGGPISLTDIQTEFGGTVPVSLSEYYRGGGLVPTDSGIGQIPESGLISLSDFYNTSAILPHPIAIGDTLLSKTFSGTAPVTGRGTVNTQSYTFNALHDNGTYNINWYMTATATYDFTYGRILVYVDGVLIHNQSVGAGSTLPDWDSSWFRDNTGTRNRSITTNLTLGFGKTVEVRMQVDTRLQNASSLNHSAFSYTMTRVS
jgi:hypothetical protein